MQLKSHGLLVSMGFTVFTTSRNSRSTCFPQCGHRNLIRKISEGARPNILDKIANGEIDLIINTPTRTGAQTDEGQIRAMAVGARIPMMTTITGARAAVVAIEALRGGTWHVAALQDYFQSLPSSHCTCSANRVPKILQLRCRNYWISLLCNRGIILAYA